MNDDIAPPTDETEAAPAADAGAEAGAAAEDLHDEPVAEVAAVQEQEAAPVIVDQGGSNGDGVAASLSDEPGADTSTATPEAAAPETSPPASVAAPAAPAQRAAHAHTIVAGIEAKLHALDHIPFEAKAWLAKELAKLKAHI